MRIRAENDPRYHYKFLFMGVCALGFALYCLYDGFIGYPNMRERGFAEFKEEMAKSQTPTMFSDPSRREMTLAEFEVIADPEEARIWETYSHDRGIKSYPDVIMQFVMAAGTGLIGLAFLWGPLRSRGRWIEASDEGITSSWGESFRYDEVEVVNKRAWRKKGIAKITYVSGGSRRTFVLDDFKYKRWATDAILYTLEQRIDQGRLTNGPPESEPEAEGEVAQILAAANGS
jgi:hypothetical protein